MSKEFRMSVVTFDTLKLAQRLRDNAKFSPEQAEQTAVALAESFSDWQNQMQLATKADLQVVKTDLHAALAETEIRIVKWVVGVGFAQVAMILAVLKLHI